MQPNNPHGRHAYVAPARDKYPSGDWRIAAEATTSNSQQHSNGIHFRGPNGGDNPHISGCTDCLVCGKSVDHIQDEAVIDYLHKTAIRGGISRTVQRKKTSLPGRNESGLFFADSRGIVPGVRL